MKSNVNIHVRSLFDGQLNNSDNIELSKRHELRPGSCKASKERAIDRPFFVSISGVAFCAIHRDGKQLREDSGKLLENPSGPLASSLFRCFDLASLCSQYEFGLCKHVKVNINS